MNKILLLSLLTIALSQLILNAWALVDVNHSPSIERNMRPVEPIEKGGNDSEIKENDTNLQSEEQQNNYNNKEEKSK